MSYRTPLETRLAKKTTKAIVDFGMIEDGDRVMVGLSGGKDSWALLQMLDVLRQRGNVAAHEAQPAIGYREGLESLFMKAVTDPVTGRALPPGAIA